MGKKCYRKIQKRKKTFLPYWQEHDSDKTLTVSYAFFTWHHTYFLFFINFNCDIHIVGSELCIWHEDGMYGLPRLLLQMNGRKSEQSLRSSTGSWSDQPCNVWHSCSSIWWPAVSHTFILSHTYMEATLYKNLWLVIWTILSYDASLRITYGIKPL